MLSKKCYYSSSKRNHHGNQGSLRKERLGTTVGSVFSLLVGFCNGNIGTVVGSFPLVFSQAKALQQAAFSFPDSETPVCKQQGKNPASTHPMYIHTVLTYAHGCAGTRKTFRLLRQISETHPSTDMFRSHQGKKEQVLLAHKKQSQLLCGTYPPPPCGRAQHCRAVAMFTTLAAGSTRGFQADAILFEVFKLNGQLACETLMVCQCAWHNILCIAVLH